MFTCPCCHTPLSERKIGSLGLIWTCSGRQGRAMTLNLLRKTIPRSLVDHLWQGARADHHHSGRPCPACERRMGEVPVVPGESKTICLDVCTTCCFVWFDPHEFETLPKLGQKPSDFEGLSDEGKTALALARLELLKQERATPEMALLDVTAQWEIILEVLWGLFEILLGL
jgi:Zn-finger nucleic acid-binding protein